MKEATGELNMTVITVVAIAAVGAFFTVFIWPRIKNSVTSSTNCASAYGCDANNKNCKYRDENNNEQTGLDCSSYYKKNQTTQTTKKN